MAADDEDAQVDRLCELCNEIADRPDAEIALARVLAILERLAAEPIEKASAPDWPAEL